MLKNLPELVFYTQKIASVHGENHPELVEVAGLFEKINDQSWPEEFPEIFNGYYNDDGTKIDPESVPIPGLCIICKKYQSDDWEENMLCTLNRNDQRDEPDFKCGMFDKI